MTQIQKQKRDILVTSALPYANGHLHLGHMLGYIQADIWVRFQKSLGNTCYYICGDDAHGTPIMINAKKHNKSPEEFIKEFHQEHLQDFTDFNIKFDNFYTTHSEENKKFVEDIYNTLNNKNYFITKEIEQSYDEKEQMFLPDRFVKGICPKCKAEDQYSDGCEVCGATYNHDELINPKSVVSGTTPIKKKSEHYFFDLPKLEPILKNWINNNDNLQPEIINKLQEWFESGLIPWDVTRDAPYFGFEIPNKPNKYFYVWLDAPIGYMASFKNFCDKNNVDFDKYWANKPENSTELIQFIGKDISYFHTLFWPAVLHAADYRKPSAIHVNGFLTVNGKKMSKSRGTFILAKKYLEYIQPEYIRYYFASKLNSKVEDIDLNLEDFVLKVNSDLIGKYINIASRTASFIRKYFDNNLAIELNKSSKELFKKFTDKKQEIENLYNSREYSHAIKIIMELANIANHYIAEAKPWELAKNIESNSEHKNQVLETCTLSLNLFKVLSTYLQPILPTIADQVALFLNLETLEWNDIEHLLLNHKINKFKPLLQRLQTEDVEKITV
tara:strand:+ start:84426 stop:86096 length:1671 start_codon:yes stop_codon:yes gene_type:complete